MHAISPPSPSCAALFPHANSHPPPPTRSRSQAPRIASLRVTLLETARFYARHERIEYLIRHATAHRHYARCPRVLLIRYKWGTWCDVDVLKEECVRSKSSCHILSNSVVTCLFDRARGPRNVRGGNDVSDVFVATTTCDKVTRKRQVQYGGGGCVKYLGGPLRSYTRKAMKSTLLEVVIRPPITTLEKDEEATGRREELRWVLLDRVLARVDRTATMTTRTIPLASSTTAAGINKKLGMNFENVGGLDTQLDDIARRVLTSRANPTAAKRLGISYVRESHEVGEASALHLIILDEMDAIARKQGSMTSDTTGVRDSMVNQLLAKMDGVKEAPNILVVGLTNRPELIDPALLRLGRRSFPTVPRHGAWSAAYKEKTGEANLRSEDDLKRNWVRKLCNNMKKPTGRSGGNATDRIHRCLEIQRRILDKTSSGILGASSDDDNRFDPSSSSSSSVSSSSSMSSSSSSEDDEEVPGTQLPQLPQLPPVRPSKMLNSPERMNPSWR
ncbi:hypothetical protein HJC23_010809 [Cyclotella cryptica]|uniref:Vesicle-fusing ATPase n=1 Tax=Cyclotella cryptica TaxID=29204 RepID=A0ABD3QNQ7_9STRA